MNDRQYILALALVAVVVTWGAIAPLAAAQATETPTESTPTSTATPTPTPTPTPEAPPPAPAAYYGDVTLDGEPAPDGTTITAFIDGEERGSITIDDAGSYGGPGAFDGKLQVNGTEAEDGEATVTFEVDGVEADNSTTWESGVNERVDLVAESEPEPSGGGGGGGGTFNPIDDQPDNPAVTVEICDAAPDAVGVTVSAGPTVVDELVFDNASVPGNATGDCPEPPGNVTITAVDDLPDAVGSPPGTPVATVDIQVPDGLENASATLRLTVENDSVSAAGAAVENLSVAHYDDENDQWETFDATVVDAGDGTTTVESDVTGFSYYAVTDASEQQTATTPTPAPTTPTPDSTTPTSTDEGPGEGEAPADPGGGPIELGGFGLTQIVVGGLLVILLVVAIAATLRRSG